MKPKTVLPSEFELKIIKHEATGEAPATVDVVIPTFTRPKEPFDVKISVLDEIGYPTVDFKESLTVVCEQDSDIGGDIAFAADQPALSAIADVALPKDGFYRFKTELNGKTFFSNPTWCDASHKEKIFWGDPHVHTKLSRCHSDKCRTLNFCFTAARHLTHLDWVGAADHVSNGRCDIAKWREQFTISNFYDDPPEFATLPAYEASLKGGCGGDNNVYTRWFPEEFIDEHDDGDAVTLATKISELMGKDNAFIVPHHTTRTGKHGEISDDIYPGEKLMPVVEIHSKWGTSEYRGNPYPLKEIHPGPSYAVDLLNRGLRLGFIGGTDSHRTMPSGFGDENTHISSVPGFTAIFAESLSRDAVFDAIRQRRCFATAKDRMLAVGTIDDVPFGANLKVTDDDKPRRIQATVAGKAPLEKVELIRNGETIHSHPCSGWKETFEHVDSEPFTAISQPSKHLGDFAYYYVRGTCSNGAIAWTSPVWLTR